MKLDLRNSVLMVLSILLLFPVLTGCDDDPGGDQESNPQGITPPGITPGENPSGRILIDHTKRDATELTDAQILSVKEKLIIAYNHTSHGSQLITGMSALERYPDFGDRFSYAGSHEEGALELRDGVIGGTPDLSQGDSVDGNGDTPWVVGTRTYLDGNPEVNVIVWSWCSINGHDAQRYVDNMEKLVAEYPDVIFIFMTGHAEGQGENLTVNSVHYNNELIREHCQTNERHLYDFADIESYDPDGNYFWDQDMRDNLDYGEGSSGNWAVEWIAANSGSLLDKLTTGTGVEGYDGCNGTAHSDSPQEANLNGILKGMAAWYLWAEIAERIE